MKDIASNEFAKEVVERSATVPVVVDFWAPWCGPCRVLGPVLESEVEALGGRVELVKINTDESPELAMEFGIQGIPAVKAFKDGKVVAEFVGAQPAPQIRKFLAQLAPAPAIAALAAAEADLKAGKHDAALASLRTLTGDPAVANRARLLLAGLLADLGRADDAKVEMAAIDLRSPEATELPSLERRIALAQVTGGSGADDAALQQARTEVASNPKNLDARWTLANALVARGELGEALEQYLEIVSRDRKFKEDGARQAMLAIFDRQGPDHELTQSFRRRLQIVL